MNGLVATCTECGRMFAPDAEAVQVGTDRCPACRGAGPDGSNAQLAPELDRGKPRPDDGGAVRPAWYFDHE